MSAPHRNKLAKPLAVGTLVLAAFAVGAAVYVTGTPMQQRQARIDERRTDQLQVLERQIHEYADDHAGARPGAARRPRRVAMSEMASVVATLPASTSRYPHQGSSFVEPNANELKLACMMMPGTKDAV